MSGRALPEHQKTERLLIEQLVDLGWEHLAGVPPGSPATNPAASERRSFDETVYPERFKKAVSRINPGSDRRPWLDGAQLDALLALALGVARGHDRAEPGVAGNLQASPSRRSEATGASEAPVAMAPVTRTTVGPPPLISYAMGVPSCEIVFLSTSSVSGGNCRAALNSSGV